MICFCGEQSLCDLRNATKYCSSNAKMFASPFNDISVIVIMRNLFNTFFINTTTFTKKYIIKRASLCLFTSWKFFLVDALLLLDYLIRITRFIIFFGCLCLFNYPPQRAFINRIFEN